MPEITDLRQTVQLMHAPVPGAHRSRIRYSVILFQAPRALRVLKCTRAVATGLRKPWSSALGIANPRFSVELFDRVLEKGGMAATSR
jgi:hypothetical protein